MSGINNDTIEEYLESFRMFIGKKKRSLPLKDLKHLLKHIGYNTTDKDLERIMIEVDSDGNGEIDEVEFVDVIIKLNPHKKARRDARCAYNAFDFMEDGSIIAKDLKQALLHVMRGVSGKEQQEVFRYFKLNKNRRITFEEFQTMIVMSLD